MNSNEFTSLLMEIEQFIDGEKLPNGYPGIRTIAVFVECTSVDFCNQTLTKFKSGLEWTVMHFDKHDPQMGGYTLNYARRDARACGQTYGFIYPVNEKFTDLYDEETLIIDLIEQYKRPQVEAILYIQDGKICKSPEKHNRHKSERVVH